MFYTPGTNSSLPGCLLCYNGLQLTEHAVKPELAFFAGNPGYCPPWISTSQLCPTPPHPELKGENRRKLAQLPLAAGHATTEQSFYLYVYFTDKGVSPEGESHLPPLGAGNLITPSPRSHCTTTQNKERVSSIPSPGPSPH